MHMNVARQYLSAGRVEDATASLQRAEDAYRQLGLLTEMGGAHLARGYVLSREEDLEGARRELEEARDDLRAHGQHEGPVQGVERARRASPGSKATCTARASCLERSIALLGTGDDPELAYAHLELGKVLVDLIDSAERRNTCARRSSYTSAPNSRWGSRSPTECSETCSVSRATRREVARPTATASSRSNRSSEHRLSAPAAGAARYGATRRSTRRRCSSSNHGGSPAAAFDRACSTDEVAGIATCTRRSD